MPVHGGIAPPHLDSALRSTIRQTLPPDEIVLVRDGFLSPPLERVIQKWSEHPFTQIRCCSLSCSRGAATALQLGLKFCSHPLVARMDADDINVETRFEQQISFMDQNRSTDVLGGWIREFDTAPPLSGRLRKVPQDAGRVARAAPFRCPLNHTSVMYRKDSVLAFGGYDVRFTGIEDYHLWAKMLMGGSMMGNLPEILVFVRTSNDLYRRRGGLHYARVELLLEREFLRMGFIHFPLFLFNVTTRLSVRLMPNRVRKAIYRAFLRSARLLKPFS